MQYINRNKLTQMCCDVKKLFSDKPGITKNLSELFHALILHSAFCHCWRLPCRGSEMDLYSFTDSWGPAAVNGPAVLSQYQMQYVEGLRVAGGYEVWYCQSLRMKSLCSCVVNYHWQPWAQRLGVLECHVEQPWHAVHCYMFHITVQMACFHGYHCHSGKTLSVRVFELEHLQIAHIFQDFLTYVNCTIICHFNKLKCVKLTMFCFCPPNNHGLYSSLLPFSLLFLIPPFP